MISWQDLDAQFKELNGPQDYTRLDIQWGSAGEHLNLSGFMDANIKQRFVALAKIAGEKLRSQLDPKDEVTNFLIQEGDPVLVWYKALWKYSPTFKHGTIAFHKSKTGEDLGNIYTGSVPNVYSASATLALNCLSGLGEIENNSSGQADVIDLKPNFFGLGINLNETFRRIGKWWRSKNA